MSGTAFNAIVYYGTDGLRLFWQTKKGWVGGEEVWGLSQPLPGNVTKHLTGSSLLLLMSDGFAGHVQFLRPNKKNQLSDEAIGEVLSSEYDIDLSVYEFASQKFSLSRDQVQISVSGLERAAFQQALQWVAAYDPKKVWLMPFSWFMSPLKAVEPALYATALDKKHILISHHYLGVDDGRELSLEDLGAYALARKEERKETHLLYVQAEAAVQAAVEKAMGDTMGVHPVIAEATAAPLLAVVQAVMERGADTLQELLHFEIDVATELPTAGGPPDVVPVPSDKQDENGDDNDQVPAVLDVSDLTTKPSTAPDLPPSSLPKPVPPPAAMVVPANQDDSTPTHDVEPTSSASAQAATSAQTASVTDTTANTTAPTAGTTEPDPVAPNSDTIELGTTELDTTELDTTELDTTEPDPVAPASTVTEVATLASMSILQQLHSAKVGQHNADRYVPVPPRRLSWWSILLWVLVTALVTAVIGGAIFWSQQEQPPQDILLPTNATPAPSATPATAPSPSPTPGATASAQLDKTKLKVTVLNATGVAGLAGQYRQKLIAAGWKSVTVGNATGAYDDAIFVYAAKLGDEILTTLQADFGKTVKRAPRISESSNADVVIIIAQE